MAMFLWTNVLTVVQLVTGSFHSLSWLESSARSHDGRGGRRFIAAIAVGLTTALLTGFVPVVMDKANDGHVIAMNGTLVLATCAAKACVDSWLGAMLMRRVFGAK